MKAPVNQTRLLGAFRRISSTLEKGELAMPRWLLQIVHRNTPTRYNYAAIY
jgi:hypothetical protein